MARRSCRSRRRTQRQTQEEENHRAVSGQHRRDVVKRAEVSSWSTGSFHDAKNYRRETCKRQQGSKEECCRCGRARRQDGHVRRARSARLPTLQRARRHKENHRIGKRLVMAFVPKIINPAWSGSVPPAVAGGSKRLESHKLLSDPPAIAGGTDPVQEQFRILRQSFSRSQ